MEEGEERVEDHDDEEEEEEEEEAGEYLAIITLCNELCEPQCFHLYASHLSINPLLLSSSSSPPLH